jgi:puromycin-sensitive aminopeptidase
MNNLSSLFHRIVFLSSTTLRRNMSCRLPTSVTPTNYSLTFTPDFKTHTFKGQAVIDVVVNTQTSRVSLNAKDFNVVNVQYEGKSAQKFELNNEQEILQVDFSSPLSPGKGKLNVEYNGVVNDTLKGFFRSKYQSPEGQEKFIYVTKFEPAFARFAFPCWDEPAIKATFDITLIVPKDLIAVSNMPLNKETVDPKDSSRKIVSFQRSVKMSTYLSAWAIGEFDYIEGNSEDGVLCRVYTPLGMGERGRFALDLVTKAIPFYSNYFGVPYPLPKMDFLAVKEYPCGAMVSLF